MSEWLDGSVVGEWLGGSVVGDWMGVVSWVNGW